MGKKAPVTSQVLSFGPHAAELIHDPASRGPVTMLTIKRAALIVDTSGVAEWLEEWHAEARERRGTRGGGRPATISFRTILILWLIIAMEEQPTHAKNVQKLIVDRLKPKAAAYLGIERSKLVSPDAWYERARHALNRVLTLIDAFPIANRKERMTRGEQLALFKERENQAEELSEKERRCGLVTNALLQATYDVMPNQFKTEAVSVSIDATAVELYARGIGKVRLTNMESDSLVSIEPDTGFWARGTLDHSDDGKQKKHTLKYAVEAELAVLASNNPADPDSVPHIVLAMGQHAPGFGPTRAARAMFDSILDRGFKLDHVTGDRAYMPHADTDELQAFLLAEGAKLVFSYKKVDLGAQEQFGGASMVEGTWYGPCLPDDLRDVTINFDQHIRDLKADKTLTKEQRALAMQEAHAAWAIKVKSRSAYRLRPKEKPDARGVTPMMSPCCGPGATASCALKDRLVAESGRKPVVLSLMKRPNDLAVVHQFPPIPGKVCTNATSMAIPAGVGMRFEQFYEFGSDDWSAHFGHGRNCVESFNGFVKASERFDLGNAGRRRLRGFAAQHFLLAITLVAANLVKIRQHIEELMEKDMDVLEASLGIILAAPAMMRRQRSRRSTATQRITYRGKRARRKQESRT